ncbi:MAG: polyphenol oxidase family protein, partial [Paracoccaceae bacterium]
MTLDIITADPLLPLRHGFCTRRGGASSGVFAGLNCGFGSSDQSEIVAINRARVAQNFGVDRVITVHQVHSADVVTLTHAHVTEPDTPLPTADALVTTQRGIALAVLTADCQPVLFADAAAGVIGAAHAGWRGALDGVL